MLWKAPRALMLAVSLVVLMASAAAARADISELIEQNKNPTAVIVPVSLQTSADGYGLMTMPEQELQSELQLSEPGKLINSYFTVVENESSDPVDVTNFDGRNVLYHLMQAHAYYAKLAQASGQADPALDHKVFVRLHVTEAYNLVLHFAQYPDYNNSRYIPANYAGKWGREIWFDQRKPELMHMDWYNLVVSSGFALSARNWTELGITAPLDFYQHYNGGIDPTKLPNVIYHEAFHWATDADGLFPMASEGNPVAEDYANYFGSSIVGRPEIAEIDEYTSRFYRHKYNKIRPIKDTEASTYNATSFGPAVFWQIRNWLGQERADQLIWNSLKPLNGSFREMDVPKAVLAAAQNDPSLSSEEVSKISALFDKYQQSYINLDKKFGNYTGTDSNSSHDLSKLMDNVDDATLQQKAVEAADRIRGLPTELRSQGVEVTQEEEARINAVADAFAEQSTHPEFRGKVTGALKKVGHGFERVGIDLLKGMGYVGGAVYSISAAPLTFGTDFFTGLVFGRGYTGTGDQRLIDQLLGGGSGVAAFYYAYVGLAAIGYSFSGPINLTSMGVMMVDGLICSRASATGTSQRDRYCVTNEKVMQVITLDTARAGARAGEDIRKAMVKVAKYIVGFAKHVL